MRALIISSDQFEDIELSEPLRQLQAKGVAVDLIASLKGSITGKHGHKVEAGLALDEVQPVFINPKKAPDTFFKARAELPLPFEPLHQLLELLSDGVPDPHRPSQLDFLFLPVLEVSEPHFFEMTCEFFTIRRQLLQFGAGLGTLRARTRMRTCQEFIDVLQA
jgi:hypothetical protein